MGVGGKKSKKGGAKSAVVNQVKDQLRGQQHVAKTGGIALGVDSDEAPAEKCAPPGCLNKLIDPHAQNRELGCQDAATMILDPSQREQILKADIHEYLINLLSDSVLGVRVAAATALRNFVSVGGEDFIDALVTPEFLELVGGHLQNLYQSVNDEKKESANATPSAGGDDDNDGVDSNQGEISYGQALDDWLQFLAVISEASDRACTSFCSVESFLNLCLDCLTIPACQSSAAELLNVMSSENDQLALFFTERLSPDQQNFLDRIISQVPTSPYLLRCAVNVAGTLINLLPTPQNAEKVLPLLLAAMQHTPVAGIRGVVPCLSDQSGLSADVQKAGIDQEHDRMRALQAAIDVTSGILNVIMEGGGNNREEDDDEAVFRQNPFSAVFVQSGVLGAVAALAKDVLPPLDDVVVKQVLRVPSHNTQVSGLQRAFLSVEVGVCSLVSNVMMLLPLDALGADVAMMWRTTSIALAERLSRAHESQAAISGVDHLGDSSNVGFGGSNKRRGGSEGDAAPSESDGLLLPTTSVFASPEALHSLFYQVESLVELLWTIQRKDTQGLAIPQPGEIDILTRVVWEKAVSVSTKVFVVGTVGCIGTKAGSNNQDLNLICGKMSRNLIQRTLEAVENFTQQGGPDAADKIDESDLAEMVEVAAESANTLMDLYSEDWYDVSAYKPLDLQSLLKNSFLPVLQQALSRLKRRSPKRAHLEEIATNLQAFLQYKQKNVKW